MDDRLRTALRWTFLFPLQLLSWVGSVPGRISRWFDARAMWRDARASAPAVLARCKRSRSVEPAELAALGLPTRGTATGPLPAGWRYTLGTVVATSRFSDHYKTEWDSWASAHRYQGVLGFFDEGQAVRLVRMPAQPAGDAHQFSFRDEASFRVGRHFVVAFDPRSKDFLIFCQIRPLNPDGPAPSRG